MGISEIDCKIKNTFGPVNSPGLIVSIFLKDLLSDGDSCDEGSALALLGDGGGRKCLFGSDELGVRYLAPLPPIGSGILTGAVSERKRF